jgi:hypothetical protein
MSDLDIIFTEIDEFAQGDLKLVVRLLKKVTGELQRKHDIGLYDVTNLYEAWKEAR